MSLPHGFPGSFPGQSVPHFDSAGSDLGTSRLSHPRHSYDQSDSDTIIEKTLETGFVVKERAGYKTTMQKHLIEQLDTLTYFVIGYQFLKYTHSSCLPPTLAHILVQIMLHAKKFTSTGPESGRQIFSEHLTSQQQHFEAAGLNFDRRKIISFVVAYIRNAILWKCLGCMIYHTLLVVFFFEPIANQGRLHLLESGSWYLFSFVGESVAQNYSPDSPWWLKLWQLGFCGLFFADIVVLILQLTIYQCIFLQSTISPRGLRLNEKEDYIMRSVGISSTATSEVNGEVPNIIHVKLYESLGEDPMADIIISS